MSNIKHQPSYYIGWMVRPYVKYQTSTKLLYRMNGKTIMSNIKHQPNYYIGWMARPYVKYQTSTKLLYRMNGKTICQISNINQIII